MKVVIGFIVLAKVSTQKMPSLKSVDNSTIPPALHSFEAIRRFWDRKGNITVASINPGEVYVTKSNEAITTLLGSCVSACIRDPLAGVGGMNHFLLPSGNGTLQDQQMSESARYGAWAMEALINAIISHGGSKGNLEIKLFGGANVVGQMTHYEVGEMNQQFILDYIEREGLFVRARDLGGKHPRKIIYFPQTGLVKVRELSNDNQDGVMTKECKYRDSLAKEPSKNNIELFD